MENLRIRVSESVGNKFRRKFKDVVLTSVIKKHLDKIEKDQTGSLLSLVTDGYFMSMITKDNVHSFNFRLDFEFEYPSIYARITDLKIKPTVFMRGLINYIIDKG